MSTKESIAVSLNEHPILKKIAKEHNLHIMADPADKTRFMIIIATEIHANGEPERQIRSRVATCLSGVASKISHIASRISYGKQNV